MNKMDNYFDFVDFFKLLCESMTKRSNEEIFNALLYTLYAEVNFEPKSYKDDVSDILKKRKAFNPKVRASAIPDMLESIQSDLRSPIIEWIIQEDVFIDKLLFAINKDTVFFSNKDFQNLEMHRNDISYVISYVLLRTVSTSDKSKNYRHSDDFNPFSNYIFPDIKRVITYDSQVFDDLIKASHYLYKNHSLFQPSTPVFNSELLSNGIKYDTYQSFDFEKSFSVTVNSDDSKPLASYLNHTKHLLIVGEGGIGKTTFLFSCMKKYHEDNAYHSIPLYVKLSECSINTDHNHMILNTIYKSISFSVNGNPNVSYKDILDEFSKIPIKGQIPEYTLLLDGFNEITSMDCGEVRSSIAEEINSLLKCSNVRIILTSREIDFDCLSIADFTIIRANGIRKKDVVEYLLTKYPDEIVLRITSDHSLLQYLKIPLFLIMFTYSDNSSSYIPHNRGGILYNFFNSKNSFYNEKKNFSSKFDKRTCLIINVILDFLLPDIGFFMEQNGIFHLSELSFEEIVQKALELAYRFVGLNAAPYTLYDQRPNSLKSILRIVSDLDSNDLKTLLRDCLGIILSDAEDNIYFSHQYIRDYFSALYCIRELYYACLIETKKPDLLKDVSYIWGISLWEKERLLLINEILSFPSEFQEGSLVYNTLCLFKMNRRTTLPNSSYALTNLINVLSLDHRGDLSKYDFSYLDLSNCNLGNLNFHNVSDNSNSSFKDSIISIDTFSTEGHSSYFQKWSLSDDELFMISISDFTEIKVWNIANQKCITTRTIEYDVLDALDTDIYYVDEIRLFRHGTLALINFSDMNGNIVVASTYDFLVDKYTCYQLLSSEKNAYYTFFDYDSINNILLAFSSDASVYHYHLNNPLSVQSMPKLLDKFNNRLITNYVDIYTREEKLKYKLKKVYILNNNLVLYIESDVFAPFFHAIDDIVYEGPDYYLPKKVEDLSKLAHLSTVHYHRGSRHINFFIYDLLKRDFNPLQLEGYPDEMTSLAQCVSIDVSER